MVSIVEPPIAAKPTNPIGRQDTQRRGQEQARDGGLMYDMRAYASMQCMCACVVWARVRCKDPSTHKRGGSFL